MTKIVADITMSLDGFVTGPDAGPESGLGRGGEPLHRWVFDGNDVDAEVLRTATEATGAVVMGRRLFDVIDGPNGWNDEMGYGAGHAAAPPVFVVTHHAPATWRLGPRFSFVTDGLASAGDQDVVVMGGGDVVRQAVVGGLVDELRIHLAAILLGSGTPLFADDEPLELAQRSVVVSPVATHLTYGVR
ncbi:MAG: hypothetical protein JWO68_2032 [Actinomycetia bacterium]|nr:hypothetical protein [Actinomycetes bacterium]